jgi:hypothetical protein
VHQVENWIRKLNKPVSRSRPGRSARLEIEELENRRLMSVGWPAYSGLAGDMINQAELVSDSLAFGGTDTQAPQVGALTDTAHNADTGPTKFIDYNQISIDLMFRPTGPPTFTKAVQAGNPVRAASDPEGNVDWTRDITAAADNMLAEMRMTAEHFLPDSQRPLALPAIESPACNIACDHARLAADSMGPYSRHGPHRHVVEAWGDQVFECLYLPPHWDIEGAHVWQPPVIVESGRLLPVPAQEIEFQRPKPGKKVFDRNSYGPGGTKW